MAIGFKLDPSTGEPMHLVFGGGESYTHEDFEQRADGSFAAVTVTVTSSAPAKDEWFPADPDAVIEALTLPADQRPAFSALKDKFNGGKGNANR
jgi:hypothetical protein